MQISGDIFRQFAAGSLAEVFRQSDVFALPSFFEGLPLVTMEAMACGCKVVCSQIPGDGRVVR